MKRWTLIPQVALFCLMGITYVSHGAGPQDKWYFVAKWTGFNQPMGMAIGTNDLVYIAEKGANCIRILDTDGNTITNWTGFNSPRDVAVSTNGYVYVTDSGINMIKVFDHRGNSITNWGGTGIENGQFSTPTSVNVLPSGNIVIADHGNYRIQVFNPLGEFIRKWGEQGCFDGQFDATTAYIQAEVGADGLIYVIHNPESRPCRRIQVFDSSGSYLRDHETYNVSGYSSISRGLKDFFIVSSSDGLFAFHGESFEMDSYFWAKTGSYVVESSDGTLIVSSLNDNSISKYQRFYRNISYNPDAIGDVPIPVVTKAEQRPGTAWMDIDYIVYDGNDTNVTTAMLAFQNSGTSLNDIIIPSTFEENTATNIGPNTKTGVSHHLTWNVAADWSVGYSDVQIEVLARDARYLIDFWFVTIPSNAPNPELTINKSALGAADLMHVWMWLVATGDSDIELVSGSIIGQAAPYTGVTLASGTTTTTSGRAFLFDRFNVVEATTAEKNQAIAARAIVGNESTYWIKPKP